MAVNNSNDSRINTRSPYYLEAGRAAPEVVVIPEDDPPINIPPTVTITATNVNPTLGDTVTLTANATDSDGTIASYLWGGTASPLTSVSIDISSPDTAESQTYYVIVTDDDGDTGTAQITINWQEQPEIVEPVVSIVECGDVVNEANFVGQKEYTLNVGDKIGTVTITFLEPLTDIYHIPVNFTATWDSTTQTTGYIGDSVYDNDLATGGVQSGDINTTTPTNKTLGTTLSINKTAATPQEISLIANSVLGNDSYRFRLDCPNVLATPTRFVTLESTCVGGTARFTYTDVDGVTQEVVIEDGDPPVVVSAQPETAVVSQCTGTITEGGASFDQGTPEQNIDEFLEINIIIDSSGYGVATGLILKEMIEGNLKQKLISFYNNDSVEYNKRVKVYDSGTLYGEQNPGSSVGLDQSEGFLKILSDVTKRNLDTTKVVNLYFLDECSPVYMPFGFTAYSQFLAGGTVEINKVTSTFETHLSEYKAHLDTLSYGEQLTTIFHTANTATPAAWFENLINGTGSTTPDIYGNYIKGFEGNRGLATRGSEISLVTGIRPEVSYQTEPEYYYNLVLEALRNYGYTI